MVVCNCRRLGLISLDVTLNYNYFKIYAYTYMTYIYAYIYTHTRANIYIWFRIVLSDTLLLIETGLSTIAYLITINNKIIVLDVDVQTVAFSFS